jgi:hypothetical protein
MSLISTGSISLDSTFKHLPKFFLYNKIIVCRVQANYMMWRYAKGLLSYLDKRAKAIQLDYEKVLTGKKTESPRLNQVQNQCYLTHSYQYCFYIKGPFSQGVQDRILKNLNFLKIHHEVLMSIRVFTFKLKRLTSVEQS